MDTILKKTEPFHKAGLKDQSIDDETMSKGLYEKYVLPRVIHFVCGLNPMMKQRQKTVPQAEGRVLEIGIGSGLNLPFYNSDKITHLWGLDPSAEMWALSKKTRKMLAFDVEFINSGAENIPLEDNSADTVLITYALCTIPDAPAALDEVRRVLKPGGRVVFCEHGAAPDAFVNRLQNWLDPVWGKIGGGCHLNREIPKMIEGSGFKIQDMDASYIMGLKFASFNYRGSATFR
jgi:ubiquinone/menaquinone biosynthesis C-methylase UbiE